jgi:hypothetical protein
MKNFLLFAAIVGGLLDGVPASQADDTNSKPQRGKNHWSFQPIQATQPPADPSGWSLGAIDQFIHAKLKANHLAPAPRAEKRTLIRRATLDLLGLPPTPQEVEEFLNDSSPDAWPRVVDRLLDSPRYGECWSRHWLDVVRYADTGGFEVDHLYPSAWKYRDYVIRSLNVDKPFDRFIQEQVAGDELWPSNPEALVATGLYCVGPALDESAMVSNQLEYEWLTDAADTTGAAFLGLTLGCARCHNHKYDPITQKEYYGMQAIFAASDRPFPEKTRLLRIKILNGLLSDAPVPKELLNDPRCQVHTEEQIGFRLVHREEPLKIHRLKRGELSKPLESVEPGLPAALIQNNTATEITVATERTNDSSSVASVSSVAMASAKPDQRRAGLAQWLVSPENPLTTRVLVNRVWAWHFGQAVVRTPNDFGKQGEPPTHPELLDWLARDFMNHGWSLKYLHRQILLSQTYQMQSTASYESSKASWERQRPEVIDPENRLLWHFPRHRLEGEAIRDSMMACVGTLNSKAFGPAIIPPLGKEELTGLFNAKEKWPVTPDRSEYSRRSVYLLVRRTFVYPMFAAFDPPELMTSCPGRQQTVVPTQALTLLNSPVAHEQARAFAQRLLQEAGDSQGHMIARAWLLAYGRPITDRESRRVLDLLQSEKMTLEQLCLALFNSNEFVFLE